VRDGLAGNGSGAERKARLRSAAAKREKGHQLPQAVVKAIGRTQSGRTEQTACDCLLRHRMRPDTTDGRDGQRPAAWRTLKTYSLDSCSRLHCCPCAPFTSPSFHGTVFSTGCLLPSKASAHEACGRPGYIDTLLIRKKSGVEKIADRSVSRLTILLKLRKPVNLLKYRIFAPCSLNWSVYGYNAIDI